MAQEITANEMLDTLCKHGFIALCINFDTDKAVIKPESFSIIEQMVAMLKANPRLAVSIERHTDTTGTAARNKTLSRGRADAVVAALVGKGIEPKRPSAVGWGPGKPLAYNRKVILEPEKLRIDPEFEEATEGEKASARKSSTPSGLSLRPWSAPKTGSGSSPRTWSGTWNLDGQEHIRNKPRREEYVKRILRKCGCPPDKQEKTTRTVLEQAEVLSEAWAVPEAFRKIV
jgi:hypothetical protein